MIKNIAAVSLIVALLATSSFAKSGKNSSSSATTTITSMTQEKKDTLLFIYQEEKVARDVYNTFGILYPNQNTFARIQGSEQKHMDKAQGLCETYGVDVSNVNEAAIGEFVVPVLQELYDTLVGQGRMSALDALKVGEYIEVTDIDDLDHAQIGMPSDVVNVYENLKAGSYNHLDAFRSAIRKF